MQYTIRAFSNCDHAFIVWQPEAKIDGCLGYALYRTVNDGQLEVSDTWLGFEGDFQGPGTHQPSTKWPIQKLLWSDYLVRRDDKVSYRVVPMVGTPDQLQERDDLASDWTDPIAVSAQKDGPMQVYFNRGILAAQWVTRLLGGGSSSLQAHTLQQVLTDPDNR